jgi:hypothetical protein
VPEREALLSHHRDAIAGRHESTARREYRSSLRIGNENPWPPLHQEKPARGARRPTTARVSPRADAHVPLTKCITGPKLWPAGAPTEEVKPAHG